jgi:hypothetical protein
LLEIADQVGGDGSTWSFTLSECLSLVLPLLKIDGASLPAHRVRAPTSSPTISDAAAQAAQILFSHAEVNRPFLEHRVEHLSKSFHRGIPLMSEIASRQRSVPPDDGVGACSIKNVDAVIRASPSGRQSADGCESGDSDRPASRTAGSQQLGRGRHHPGHVPGCAVARLWRVDIRVVQSRPNDCPDVLKEEEGGAV